MIEGQRLLINYTMSVETRLDEQRKQFYAYLEQHHEQHKEYQRDVQQLLQVILQMARKQGWLDDDIDGFSDDEDEGPG